MLQPEDIQIIGDEVGIRWSDGVETYCRMEKLRALSPSAETTGERDLLGVKYGGEEGKSYAGVRVTGWQVVGGYAVAFSFSDGHKTGIYSYEYLRAVARELE
jgi:DUF971 family protein